MENTFITYSMDLVGHYAFKIVATDNANNIEIKNNYDFVINFDPSSDKLAFTDVPQKWGESELQIEFSLLFRHVIVQQQPKQELIHQK